MGGVGTNSNTSSMADVVRERQSQLATMTKQEKVEYLEQLIEAQQYRKNRGEDTSTVDAIIEVTRNDLNESNKPSAKEQAYMNYKAIKISKNMPKEEQDRRRKLKAQYLKEYKSL